MQGFNNNGNYGNNNWNNNANVYGNSNMANRNYNSMSGYQNYRGNNQWNNQWNDQNRYDQGNYNQNGYYQQPHDERIYVVGRIGADAYQLPPGVDKVILWDDEDNRFYVKGYDEKGRPRVLADNDYFPHVEKDNETVSVDMSQYATKDDIRNMISDAIKKMKLPNMNGYVTTDTLDKVISELTVGTGGKVVRSSDQ